MPPEWFYAIGVLACAGNIAYGVTKGYWWNWLAAGFVLPALIIHYLGK